MNTNPKVCGICGAEIDFTRRELQVIHQLLHQALLSSGKGLYASDADTLELFQPIAHKIHTERKA